MAVLFIFSSLFSSNCLHCLCISFIIIRTFKDNTAFVCINCPVIFALYFLCVFLSGFKFLGCRHNASHLMCMAAFRVGVQCSPVSGWAQSNFCAAQSNFSEKLKKTNLRGQKLGFMCKVRENIDWLILS